MMIARILITIFKVLFEIAVFAFKMFIALLFLMLSVLWFVWDRTLLRC